MNWKETKKLISEDLERYEKPFSWRQVFLRLMVSHSFKITFWYRVGHWAVTTSSVMGRILWPFIWWRHKNAMYLTGIQLPMQTKVGGGIFFPHFSGIIIHYGAEIGRHCTIHQCVTLGTERHKKGNGLKVGDRCVISTGAKIIGPLTIGNDCVIGANAVVTKDLPDGAVVVGVNKILNFNGAEYSKLH